MSETTRLALPMLAAAQAQKHLTLNDAFAALDALVHLSARDRDRAAPPASPAEGDRHLVAPGASGAWAGRSGMVAVFDGGVWRFHAPRAGWILHVEAERRLLVHDGTTFAPLPGSFGTLGVNAAPDAFNRVAMAAANVLLTDEGAGLRVKVNKTAAGDTASYLFQTGWSGRAEFGLVGGDDFKLKVSADGAAWTDALAVDRASGATRLKSLTLESKLALADGGTGASTAAGARVALGLSAVAASGSAADLGAGKLPDARLPERLGTIAAYVGDWNEATANGWYMAPIAANAPFGGNVWFLGETLGHGGSGWCTQTLHAFALNTDANTDTYRRQQRNGTWGAWTRVWQTEPELDGRYLRRAGGDPATGPLRLASYTVATLPAAALHVNGMTAVSDGAGARRLAVSDGVVWRWPDGTTVS